MDEGTVILEIDSKEYVCSKKRLSECSEYFNVMFHKDFSEKTKSRIKIHNISIESWEHILEYLEKGYIDADLEKIDLLDEMLELLHTVNMFQFTQIEEMCSDIIFMLLKTTNCFQIMDKAGNIGFEVLTRKIRVFALWHFDDITKLDSFYNIQVDQLEWYCGDPGLRCSSGEWGVWIVIGRWLTIVAIEGTAEPNHTSRLLLCLRLSSLSISDLKQIASHDSVKACPRVLEALNRIVSRRSHDRSGERNNINDSDDVELFIQKWLTVKPRILPLVPCVVGSIYSAGDVSSPFVIMFNESEKKFIPLFRLEKMESHTGTVIGFKVVSDGFRIYILGGSILKRQNSWNNDIWVYDPLKKTWSLFARLMSSVRHMMVCLLHNELYILGGFGRHRVKQNKVSKLCLSRKIWSECSSMPEGTSSTCCVAFRDSLYLIDSKVYEYSSSTDSWILRSFEPFPMKGFTRAVADDQFIYLVAICKKVIFKFDPDKLVDGLKEVGSFKRECIQACLMDEFIYSLSQDEYSEDIFCEKLSVKTGISTTLYEGRTDSVIADLDPIHRHGCFSLYQY